MKGDAFPALNYLIIFIQTSMQGNLGYENTLKQ